MEHKSSSQRLTEAMVQAQAHWQKQHTMPGLTASAPPAPFTIALSREAGSNGPSVARAVASRLGWALYDQEILRAIAQELGVRTQLLESVDEKHKNWLRDAFEQFTAMPTVSQDTFVRHLVEMLLSLATHGECVIVGRGAAQILPKESTLRVRLVGPRVARVAAIQQRFGISHADAARWVEQTDLERARFVKEHFRKDPGDAAEYDLTLNSTRLSVQHCADLIIDALHRLQAQATARAPAVVSAK